MLSVQETKYLCRFLKSAGGDDLKLKSIRRKLAEDVAQAKFRGTVYIDVPGENIADSDEESWTNLGEADSVAEAVRWIRDNIGPCDDFGNINLLTLGDAKDVGEDEDCDAAATA